MTSLPSSPPPGQRTSPWRWVIIVLGLTILMLGLFRSIDDSGALSSTSLGLRKISTVPPFALTERSGKTITNHDLAGKIWIADFVYTTCPGPCPVITAKMARIQKAVADDPQVRLVSFTVDPAMDTPAVLSKYADTFGADPDRWLFLTGAEKPLFDLIQNGFLQVVQDNKGKPPEPGQYKVTHSTYIALVDGEGNIRGFYDGTSDESLEVLRDIKLLEKEAAQ